MIRAVSGDRAEVEMLPASLEGCPACGLCGDRRGTGTLVVEGGRGLGPGQVVEVEVSREASVGTAAVGFLLPVGALCLGAVVGSNIPDWTGWTGFSGTSWAVAGAVIALLLSLVVVRAYDRALRRRSSAAHIVRVVV